MRRGHFFVLGAVVLSVPTGYANDITPLLERATWAFSEEEVAKINDMGNEEVREAIAAAVAEATNTFVPGELLDAKLIDLNGDGISELVARIDLSGRRVSMDFHIVSRSEGKYFTCLALGQGIETDLWAVDRVALAVGQVQSQSISRSDAGFQYPILYAWTGTDCRQDSSELARTYYEVQFVPRVRETIRELSGVERDESNDGGHEIVLSDPRSKLTRAVGLSAAIVSVNGLFDDPLILESEIAELQAVLGVLELPQDRETSPAQTQRMREEISNASANLNNEISRMRSR